MERLICLAAGYLFGLFQTGYLYGKMHQIDIRQHGSGNSGTTNALRVLGKKAGIIVFFGDFLKTFLPCTAVRLLIGDGTDTALLYVLYMGLGVILGHNYPFYLKFQGGKGIAATAGLIVALDWRLTLLSMAVFVISVAMTRYVSLGSLMVASLFFLWNLYFALTGRYLLGNREVFEFIAVSAVVCIMAFWRHRANIVRLLRGTENKLRAKNKKE